MPPAARRGKPNASQHGVGAFYSFVLLFRYPYQVDFYESDSVEPVARALIGTVFFEKIMVQTVAVTGANRGIGLAICNAFHERGDVVYGLCRTSSDALKALGLKGGVIEGTNRTLLFH